MTLEWLCLGGREVYEAVVQHLYKTQRQQLRESSFILLGAGGSYSQGENLGREEIAVLDGVKSMHIPAIAT